MFSKLLATILTLGLTAAALLVIRQHRIDIAHEMAQSHQRLVEYETQLWRLRTEVVTRCRPEDIRQAVEQSDLSWTEIPTRPAPPQPVQDALAERDQIPPHAAALAGG